MAQLWNKITTNRLLAQLPSYNNSWLLQEANIGRLPLKETTISSRQPYVHHSETRYLELLDIFNDVTETYHLTSLTVSPGITEPYHLTLLDSCTWRYWTVSPDVTGQFHLMHLALLNCITWCYWTISPGITEPFHLTLLDSFTCHYWTYWTVSPCVTETYHLTLQDSNQAVQYATTNSLICDCFLKWSQSTWQISQWQKKISWSIFSKKLTN